MPQSDNVLITHSPAYTLSIVTSGLSTAFAILEGQFVLVAFLAAFTALLVASRLGMRLSPRISQSLNQFVGETKGLSASSEESSTPRKLSILLALLALSILWISPLQGGVWIYGMPLMLMFFFDFKVVVPVLTVISLISVGLISLQDNPLVAVQAAPNFIFFLGAACALVYLRELRRRQLKPLRRTDNLSDAASQQHLHEDLQKEIQRSEREGSDLSLIAIKIDQPSIDKFSEKEHDLAQIELGKLLHNSLRLFDSYYRLEQHQFLIVLPHTRSKQAIKIADALRIKIKQNLQVGEVHLTVSAGVSHLNVGDDSQSLVANALSAQSKAQIRGGDQYYLFTEKDFEEESSGAAE